MPLLSAIIKGVRGTVATVRFAPGDVIHRLGGRLSAFPTKHTVQIAKDVYVDDPRIRDMRSSEMPTVQVLNGVMYACQPIMIGDEVTISRSPHTISVPRLLRNSNHSTLRE